MKDPFYVQIIERATKIVLKQLECDSNRDAVRVEKGVRINLDSTEFKTIITTTPSTDCEIDK